MSARSLWVYLDGAFVPAADAKVSVTDHSFLYGDGCFEGIGVYAGKVLHLDAHVERLYRSARMLRIPMPVPPDELRSLIVETGSRNGMDAASHGYLRPVLSRGAGPMGLRWTVGIEHPTLTIIPQLDERHVDYGSGEMTLLSAIFTSQVRALPSSIDPRIKTNNYITSIMAFLEAHDRGADIAILRDDRGYLSEGHAMNLFCVREGRILSPMESAALGGITRSHVAGVARELGREVVESNLTAYDLICADEAFVTSSLEGVAAIRSIDGRALPAPGPITELVRERYVKLALENGTEIPPFAGASPGRSQ
jgi:branched-chain amino acid aminotransferase